MVEASRSYTPYTLILLDMRMPGGWDGLRTARELQEIAPETPIILVSAWRDYTVEHMRENLSENMGNNFIVYSKPYQPDELRQLANYVAYGSHQYPSAG